MNNLGAGDYKLVMSKLEKIKKLQEEKEAIESELKSAERNLIFNESQINSIQITEGSYSDYEEKYIHNDEEFKIHSSSHNEFLLKGLYTLNKLYCDKLEDKIKELREEIEEIWGGLV